jgi:hypothetical protein
MWLGLDGLDGLDDGLDGGDDGRAYSYGGELRLFYRKLSLTFPVCPGLPAKGKVALSLLPSFSNPAAVSVSRKMPPIRLTLSLFLSPFLSLSLAVSLSKEEERRAKQTFFGQSRLCRYGSPVPPTRKSPLVLLFLESRPDTIRTLVTTTTPVRRMPVAFSG